MHRQLSGKGSLQPSPTFQDLHRLWNTSAKLVIEQVFNRDDELTLIRDGTLIKDRVFTADGLAGVQACAAAIFRELEPDHTHREWVLAPHQWLPLEENWIWLVALQPQLISMVAKQLGVDENEIVLFSTQLTDKPPLSGEYVPWHQDGDRCCTVWIALDDVDEENGCLLVMPGWHKRGRLPFKKVRTEADVERASFYIQHHLFELDPGISMTRFERGQQPVCLHAGGIEIHSSYTPHRSMPNTSRHRHRRALILRYQPLSEPLGGGTLTHWSTGQTCAKINYHIVNEC
eukprot:TRINITY_DN7447_c0_g3_i1.p1 TRINITY_DN7447_c0_g3~~TRINITY_DN7447_c0_g3_i1.p1  ORF type:complete len:288 (+),score=33.87 TRINITY_DN7447_c0_g3_i1:187-1050(+)